MEELIPDCREIVGNLTELESEVGVFLFIFLHSYKGSVS